MEPDHSNWPRIFRPLGKGFRADVVWGVAVLVGAALAAGLFYGWDGFTGSVIGVLLVISARAVHRGWQRRPR